MSRQHTQICREWTVFASISYLTDAGFEVNFNTNSWPRILFAQIHRRMDVSCIATVEYLTEFELVNMRITINEF